MIFAAPPLPSLFPQSLFMQIMPLQTDSGLYYVNPFPIKTLSKQIFRKQQKEEVVNGPQERKFSLWWTSSTNVCVVLCWQGDLCKQHRNSTPLWRWSAALMHVCLWAFQFKALICMCEMCCWGVKCCAVPSSTEVAAHPHPRWGGKTGLERHQHFIFNLADKKMFCVCVRRCQQGNGPPRLSPCFLFLSTLLRPSHMMWLRASLHLQWRTQSHIRPPFEDPIPKLYYSPHVLRSYSSTWEKNLGNYCGRGVDWNCRKKWSGIC